MKFAPLEILSRLTIGIVFMQSGWGKFQDLTKVVSYFESFNIPLAHLQAPFVSGLELVAGLFILIGLFTRISSLSLIPVMIVALMTAQREEITDLSSLFGQSEYLYILILGWLATVGSKFLCVDHFIKKHQGSLVSRLK